MSATEARQEPGSGRIAIKTERPDPKQAWFVYDPAGGGHYAQGNRAPDKVDDWPAYTFTPAEEP